MHVKEVKIYSIEYDLENFKISSVDILTAEKFIVRLSCGRISIGD